MWLYVQGYYIMSDKAASAQASISYKMMLQQARDDINLVDFGLLRHVYVSSTEYTHYTATYDFHLLAAALEMQHWEEAERLATNALMSDFLNPQTHFALSQIKQVTNDTECASWHQQFGRSIIKSILSSGDGHGSETAFKVINIREEYDVLATLRLRPIDQLLIVDRGRYYDVFTVKSLVDPEVSITIYFEIETFPTIAK